MMFYTHLFTSTRGPLAKIWLAAHWERKLTKAQVSECNLEIVIEDIISPKMKIGLRTSGHLLVGVVRIYSRKAKYLLADCSEALIKVQNAFRPGQTDLAVEELEAERKAITLIEDFTAFDAQLPDLSDIDIVDHFSLNQSRTEEITLKEDFRNEFLTLVDFGDESQISHTGLLDMNLQSLSHHGDDFGDEGRGSDLLDFLTNSSDNLDSTHFITEEPWREKPSTPKLHCPQGARQMEVETSALGDTTLLTIEENGFALEPVPITPNLEKKRGKRKRKLIVDLNKELSDADIREQILDFSDLVVTMVLAPPTLQLMLWKENGGAHRLFARPCSCVVAPQVIELFSICGRRGVQAEVELMRQDTWEGQGDSGAVVPTDSIRIVDSSLDPELTFLSPLNDPLDDSSSCMQMEKSELAQPELPSEDSMWVHQSLMEEDHLSFSNTPSAEDSQLLEDSNIKRHAQNLLAFLKTDGQASFSLKSLCDGVTRSQAATTFFCLLVLSKQKSLQLEQDAPYKDVLITPKAAL